MIAEQLGVDKEKVTREALVYKSLKKLEIDLWVIYMGSTPPHTGFQDDITFLVGNPYINLCGCYWVGGRSKHIRKYDIFGQISSRPISAGWEFPPTVVKSKGIQNALIIQVQDNAKLICPVTFLSLFKGTFPTDTSSIYIISHIVLQNTVIIRR